MSATFAMFTDAGDRAVAHALTAVAATATARPDLLARLAGALDPVMREHPEVRDTESECAVVAWVNVHICARDGLVPISRDDLYALRSARRNA